MKKVSFITAMIFGLLLATTAFAQPKHGGGMNGFGSGENFIANKLNLSDEQNAQFQDLMTEMKKSVIKIRSQIELKKLDIESVLRAKDFTPEKLTALSEEINQLQNELRNARMSFWTEVYNILDNNQKEMWKKGFLRFMKNAEEAQRVGMREMKEKRMNMMQRENRMNMMKNDKF